MSQFPKLKSFDFDEGEFYCTPLTQQSDLFAIASAASVTEDASINWLVDYLLKQDRDQF